MNRYAVKITDEARLDMEKIYEYIAEQLYAPESAMKQYNRIAEAILSLDSFPERYALLEMEPEHSWGMRRMIIDNYIICYIVDSETVTVTDVLYGVSDLHKYVIERYSP